MVSFRKIKSAPRFLLYRGKQIYHRAKYIPKMILLIKNWGLYVIDSFYLLGKRKRTFYFRNGLKITFITGTYDSFFVGEVFDESAYFDNNKNTLENVRTIVDLGAQIGIFSLFAAHKFPNAKIIAIEAGAENYSLLEENIAQNNLEDRIMILHRAVWSTSQKPVTLAISKTHSGGHSVIKSSSNSEKEEVETITLSEIMSSYNFTNFDLIKIDIEGAEYEVIYNAPKDVLRSISFVTMEAHEIDEEKNNPQHLKKFLEANEFAVNLKDRFYLIARKLSNIRTDQ